MRCLVWTGASNAEQKGYEPNYPCSQAENERAAAIEYDGCAPRVWAEERRSDPADPRSGWEYLILPGAWKSELCAGFNASTVARSLADNGLLRGDAGGKTSTTVTIPGQ